MEAHPSNYLKPSSMKWLGVMGDVMSKSYARTKKKFYSTAIGSFIGIMAAIPVAMGLYNPGALVGATQDQKATSTAEVSGVPADFMQYAYAYDQGYAAHASSSATSSSASAGAACAESTVSTGEGEVLGASTTKQKEYNFRPHAEAEEVIHSYNEYKSFVYNSSTSTINNTNSNNTVGSNNTNKTEIDIEDSEKLSVDVDNKTNAMNISTDDSFNKDSYNTETENVAINESFNIDKTLAINGSGEQQLGDNTTSTAVAVDVDKTISVEKTVDIDASKTIDIDDSETTNNNSYNEADDVTVTKGGEIEGGDIETDSGSPCNR